MWLGHWKERRIRYSRRTPVEGNYFYVIPRVQVLHMGSLLLQVGHGGLNLSPHAVFPVVVSTRCFSPLCETQTVLFEVGTETRVTSRPQPVAALSCGEFSVGTPWISMPGEPGQSPKPWLPT